MTIPRQRTPARGLPAGKEENARSAAARVFSKTAFLYQQPLFRTLDTDCLTRIATGTQIIEAPRGSVLFRRGDRCSGFHVIVHGQVKLAVSGSQGSEKIIELLGSGQSFGEAVMFLGQPYHVGAETLADSKLLLVSREVLLDELKREPALALRMLASLSARMHGLVAELEAQTVKSGSERVAAYLLRLSDSQSGPVRRLQLPARKNVIASRLNLTKEHFSRILHALSGAGLITVEGQQIMIHDAQSLRRQSGDSGAVR